MKDMVEKTIAHYGRLDVQVNNAGYEGPNAAITDQTYDNFIGVYNINVFGPFFGMKYAMKQMIAQEKGAIVNIASNGSFVGAAGMSPYVSSKHAVLGLSKCAALEGAAHGIHVNCICPGAINTPMMRKIKKEFLPLHPPRSDRNSFLYKMLSSPCPYACVRLGANRAWIKYLFCENRLLPVAAEQEHGLDGRDFIVLNL